MAFNSEEEFLQSQDTGGGWTPDSDYEAPKNDPRLNQLNSQSALRTGMDAAQYQRRRMTESMKQAWYKLNGDKYNAGRIQADMDTADQDYKNYMRSPFNKHRTAAAVGNVMGGITHPVSLASMPFGGGSTVLTRALAQAGISAGTEVLTNPGGIGDRVTAGVKGAVGGAVGSAGGDLVAKGWSGLRGNWTDDVARRANEFSKRNGTSPGIGQLREYSGKQMTPDELAARGGNWPYTLEKGAQHRQEVDARKLKQALGGNQNPKLAAAFPKEDAKVLEEALRKEATEIWKPFHTAAKASKTNVRPDELWNNLKVLDLHNSKILKDSSAIPDDVVRKQLNDLLQVDQWTKLPKYTPEEYSKIVSELSNAQNRVKTLSTGQTPTYDGASVARVTGVFDGAKKDMTSWGKKEPAAFSAWEKSLTDYQEKILPVKDNPIFKTSKDLDDKGNDLYRLMGDATEGTNYDYMRRLLKEYQSRGMDDAAGRLDLLDANSLAAQHGASGMAPTIAGVPKVPGGGDMLSLLGPGYSYLANRPSVKGLYFGDPMLSHKGPLSTFLRKSPVSIGRELGDEATVGTAAMIDFFNPFSSDGEENNNDQFSHGGNSPGAVTQHTTRP